jgi:hypothetical protein
MPQVRPFLKLKSVHPWGSAEIAGGLGPRLRSIWVDMPAIIIYLVPIQKW